MDIGKLFSGVTTAKQQMFISSALKHVKEKHGIVKINAPCVGQFTLVRSAIEAGIKNENIYASDYSLFSAIVGYFYSGRKLDTLPLIIADEYVTFTGEKIPVSEDYGKLVEEIDKASYLLWLMKILQLKHNAFEQVYLGELLKGKNRYLSDLKKTLTKHKEIYDGINYDILDIRDVLDQNNDEETLTVFNPPAYRMGFTKMFPLEPLFHYDPKIEEFIWDDEFPAWLDKAREKNIKLLTMSFKRIPDHVKHEEIIYAEEYTVDRYEYWMSFNPEMFD